MIEDVIRRMRWKAFFFLRGENGNAGERREVWTEKQKLPTSSKRAQSFQREALKVADRIDALSRREAFVTLKDHKENFE